MNSCIRIYAWNTNKITISRFAIIGRLSVVWCVLQFLSACAVWDSVFCEIVVIQFMIWYMIAGRDIIAIVDILQFSQRSLFNASSLLIHGWLKENYEQISIGEKERITLESTTLKKMTILLELAKFLFDINLSSSSSRSAYSFRMLTIIKLYEQFAWRYPKTMT